MQSSERTLGKRVMTLAYGLWFVVTGLAVVIVILAIPGYLARLNLHYFYPDAEIVAPQAVIVAVTILATIFTFLGTLGSMGMSALLLWRGQRSFMVVFTSLFLMGFSVIIPGPLELAQIIHPELFPPVFAQVMWFIYFSAGVTWLFWIFPNGRYVPGLSRYLVLPTCILTTVTAILTSGGNETATTLAVTLSTIVSSLVLFSLGCQVYRYFRISTITEKQQTRWVLIGTVVLFVLLGVSSIGYTTDPVVPVTTWRLIGGTLWSLAMAVIPISLTIPILRYRLWAVDLIIRRTLTYGLITLVMAGTYYGGVVLLQTAFVRLTGQGSPLAVVASTLAIAALFNPLRTRVQTFIDRRFDRRKYDAQRTLDDFAASARDEVDMFKLEQSLIGVVHETMQPESVSLWLRDTRS